MSRPKPKILLSHTDPVTRKSEQILVAEAIYAVFYDGKPMNVRLLDEHLAKYKEASPKYKKSSFPSAAHAFNLAERLNKMFNTDKFQVYKMSTGEVITE